MSEIFEKTLLTAFSLFVILSFAPILQELLNPIIDQSEEISKMKDDAENDLNLFLNRFNQFNTKTFNNSTENSSMYHFIFKGEIIISQVFFSSKTNLIFYFYYKIEMTPFSYVISISNNYTVHQDGYNIRAYIFSYDQYSIFIFFF